MGGGAKLIKHACDGRIVTESTVLIASTIVHGAILVQKTPQSQRSSNLKEKAQEILTKASVEQQAMDKFSVLWTC